MKLPGQNYLSLMRMERPSPHAFDVEYWFVRDRTKKFGEKDAFISFPDARKLLKEGKRQPEDFQPVAKYFKVFNAEQVQGLPVMKVEQENKVEINQTDLVNTLSQEMNVPINFDGGDNAYYSPKEDAIHLPTVESFKSEYAFNSTALHDKGTACQEDTYLSEGNTSVGKGRTAAKSSKCHKSCRSIWHINRQTDWPYNDQDIDRGRRKNIWTEILLMRAIME